MLAALTTNVTNFFREPHHFEHLKTHVLPPLVSAAKRGGRVRFWSAGCSSGQEPYSIALTIFSLMPDADAHDVKVLATDIDSYMVARAREGTYSESAVSHVPADLRNRYFTSSRDSGERVWTVADRVRKLVVCRELNLNGPWPMQGPFQAIFCRNVVIYFDEAAQQRIWSRFVPLLSAEGWLYVGHSERVCGSAAAVLVSEGITSYRLRRAAP
jgi:chemotaxis protein methyltransferase CheR